MDTAVLNKISYGLYVVSCNDGEKDCGLIVNTVCQITSSPITVAVTVNKSNYCHDVIAKTGILNVSTLSEDAPFSVFENFGFRSSRDTRKFDTVVSKKASNGVRVLVDYVNSYMCLKVETAVDADTHTIFICSLVDGEVLTDAPSMTYTYYHKNVKPKPAAVKAKGYVCRICGYVYEGEELPADFVCPLCKHGAEDFEALT